MYITMCITVCISSFITVCISSFTAVCISLILNISRFCRLIGVTPLDLKLILADFIYNTSQDSCITSWFDSPIVVLYKLSRILIILSFSENLFMKIRELCSHSIFPGNLKMHPGKEEIWACLILKMATKTLRRVLCGSSNNVLR